MLSERNPKHVRDAAVVFSLRGKAIKKKKVSSLNINQSLEEGEGCMVNIRTREVYSHRDRDKTEV